jgi:hypothetical protein
LCGKQRNCPVKFGKNKPIYLVQATSVVVWIIIYNFLLFSCDSGSTWHPLLLLSFFEKVWQRVRWGLLFLVKPTATKNMGCAGDLE